MDGRAQQEKQLARLNSSASVSDLSEALSDMSLSTSPGSGDIIAQELKSLPLSSACEQDVKEEVTIPPSRKRLVVRQLSSNPYLASAEMSPSDEHPLIASSHSYAAGESRLYHNIHAYSDRESVDLFKRSNSYPLTSDCVEETDEEEEVEDEDEESQLGDNTTHHDIEYNEKLFNSSLRNSDMYDEGHQTDLDSSLPINSNCTSNSGRKLDITQNSCPNFTTMLTPGVSPTPAQSSRDLDKCENDNDLSNGHGCKKGDLYSRSLGDNQHHYYSQKNNYGYRHHCCHNHNYLNYHPPNQQSALNQKTHFQTSKAHTENQEHDHGISKNNKNGFSNSKKSYMNDSSVRTSGASSSRSDSQASNKHQSRVMEVNAWGHFYRQQENHYKYRRSHYSSDSEDETMPHSHSGGKVHHSKQTRPQYHQHFRNPNQHRGRQQSPSYHRDNANKSLQTIQLSSDKAGRSQSGIKPNEFKERFQVIFNPQIFYLSQ